MHKSRRVYRFRFFLIRTRTFELKCPDIPIRQTGEFIRCGERIIRHVDHSVRYASRRVRLESKKGGIFQAGDLHFEGACGTLLHGTGEKPEAGDQSSEWLPKRWVSMVRSFRVGRQVPREMAAMTEATRRGQEQFL